MCLVLFVCVIFFFVKQKTAYEMRIRYWSSDVCSSDLVGAVGVFVEFAFGMAPVHAEAQDMVGADRRAQLDLAAEPGRGRVALIEDELVARRTDHLVGEVARLRSEEHTSELQSLMRISYAVFCLKKKNNNTNKNT